MEEITTELAPVAAALASIPDGDYVEKVTFPNGRGVSIIRNRMSYGHTAGLFEVAVLDSEGELDYSTPVTDDVIGWLDPDGVLEVMKQVAALPGKEVAAAANRPELTEL